MNGETLIGMMHQRIHTQPIGSAFVASDFTDLMDYETAKKSLLRLEQTGAMRRVMRGVYDRPQYSELLQEYAAPSRMPSLLLLPGTTAGRLHLAVIQRLICLACPHR